MSCKEAEAYHAQADHHISQSVSFLDSKDLVLLLDFEYPSNG
jgi:hypothetical protein